LFADDLADLLDHLSWSSVVVAGASMGGSVALAFAQLYPQRTTGLGLFDTTAWYGPTAPKDWAQRADKALKEGLSALVDFQKTRWFSEKFRESHPDVVQSCVETFLKNDPAAYAQACNMLGAADLRAGLSAIRAPTHVLVGEEDYAAPVAMAQAMHAGIPGSTITIMPGARHLTPLEIPDTVAATLRQLI
jgi:3-oxoadipate enol-lactonase